MGPDALTRAFTTAATGVQPVPLAGQADKWSQLFAMVIGFAFLAGLTVLIAFNRWNRSDLDSEHAVHILTQLNTLGSRRDPSVVVRSADALGDSDVLADIRGLFHGEQSSEPKISSASRELLGEVRAELHARAPPVSKVPARAVQEAVLTALFGAVAILPIAVWRNAATGGGGGGGGASAPDILAVLSGGLDIAVDVVMAFPFTEVLFSLALSFGVLGAEILWTTWFLPPVVLLALAAAYWWLERRVETDRDLSGPPVSGWTRRFVTLAVLTWFVGASFATLGSVIPGPWFVQFVFGVLAALGSVAGYVFLTRNPPRDTERDFMTDGGERPPEDSEDSGLSDVFPTDDRESEDDTEESGLDDAFTSEDDSDDGEESEDSDRTPLRERFHGVNWKRAAVIGVLGFGFAHQALAFLAALTVAGVVARLWLGRTLYRWRASARRDGRDALALDVVHSLTVTAAALTLPLTIGYAIAAFGTGKALTVAGIILSAPPSTLYAVLILAVMVALAAAVVFADQFRDVRRGIRRALSVQAVRSVVFARALPFALMAISAILALAFGLPPAAVVAVPLAVGLIARFGFMAYNWVTFRAHTRDGRDRTANRVVIHGRKVTDADGTPVFIADVNGHRTAHRDLDALIRQIQRDGRSLFADGEADSGSFARYYYVNGVRRGKVDMEAVASELLGDVLTRFKANVRQTDATPEDIREKLNSEYPEHVVQRVVSDLKKRGRVSEREDRFVWLG